MQADQAFRRKVTGCDFAQTCPRTCPGDELMHMPCDDVFAPPDGRRGLETKAVDPLAWYVAATSDLGDAGQLLSAMPDRMGPVAAHLAPVTH